MADNLDNTISQLRIGVFDPNNHIRNIVKGLLRSLNVEHVFSADFGPPAIKVLHDFDMDLLIVDGGAPTREGIKLIQQIRRGKAHVSPAIPLIMMSSSPDRGDVITARDIGVDELMAKPIAPGWLHKKIARCVQHRRRFIKSENFCGPDRRRTHASTVPYQGEERRRKY